MALRTEHILLDGIVIEEGRLPLLASHVDSLAKSISEVGLLEPIVVCRRKHAYPPVVLVAGRHRLEACRKLKMKEITALVENEDSPAIERWRVLAEIDENLIRRELTAAQRAKLVGLRKSAYEAVHPETKQGKAPAGRGGRKEVAKLASSFVADTASKSGQSGRSIARDATRAKALGADLDRVAGTSLDKGTELDALVSLPAEARAPIIARAAAGEEISAIGLAQQMRTRASCLSADGATVPINRQINKLTLEIDTLCDRVERWSTSNSTEIDADGRASLIRFLHVNADKLLKVAQHIDGR